MLARQGPRPAHLPQQVTGPLNPHVQQVAAFPVLDAAVLTDIGENPCLVATFRESRPDRWRSVGVCLPVSHARGGQPGRPPRIDKLQVFRTDRAATALDQRALDQILQLADVPGKIVRRQGRQGFAGEFPT